MQSTVDKGRRRRDPAFQLIVLALAFIFTAENSLLEGAATVAPVATVEGACAFRGDCLAAYRRVNYRLPNDLPLMHIAPSCLVGG